MSFQPAQLSVNWATDVELGKGSYFISATRSLPLTIDLPHEDVGSSFNNSILFWRGRILMTYRHQYGHPNVLYGYSNVIIAELDDKFKPVGKTKLLIENAQDGRLCILNGGLYCSYSSILGGERCHMHICKLDDNLNVTFDKHFNPIKNPTKHLEKNWVFCSMDGEIFCVYDYQPQLTIWRMNEDFEITDTITKDPVVWEFGEVRGGTPPILIDGNFVSIVHSIYRKKYVNAVLRMTKEFDFISLQRVDIDIDNFLIIFPCGLAELHGRYFVSYGVEDRSCRIRELLMCLA